MKLSLILKRLSVQVAAIGGTLTTVAGSLAAAGVPHAGAVAVAGAVLTAAGTVIAAFVPQASVASYNPQTHDLMEKAQ